MATQIGVRRTRRTLLLGCLIGAPILFVGGLFFYFFYFFSMRYDMPFRIAGHYEKKGVTAAVAYTVAPDSKTIVYSSPVTGHGDLWSMDREGKNSKQLTANPDSESGPSYAPDGRQIVFSRETDKCGHIWIMNADGTGATQLTSGSDYDEAPLFTPDGQNIWFYRTRLGMSFGYFTMFTMTSSGKNIRPLDVDISGEGSQFRIAPDGKWVYFSRRDYSNIVSQDRIWRMKLDGSSLQSFMDGSGASVSTDSKKIAFVTGKGWNELWMVDADGSRKRLVYSSKGSKGGIFFSADGHSLFFMEESPQGARGIFISTVNTDGSAYHRLKNILP